ncbi:MAG: dihydrolipoyl dehydrogenase [Actinobacteria bacterium]|nr:dihydrolipoyl dehydrogenase [Actinomycetota bacterium]
MPQQTDVGVVGGGPGGYVAALRAAALGARVTLIERDTLGGVCLNWGCIPSKALLRSAEVLQLAQRAAAYGVVTGDVRADFPAMVARKDRVVRQLVRGVQGLLEASGVTVMRGTARLAGAGALEVTGNGTTDVVVAKALIVATGSSPARPPIPGIESAGVLDSTSALALAELPKHIVVAGAGAVGVEFATLFALLGCQVTLVEMLPAVVPNEDADISEAMRKILVQQGVTVHTATRIVSVKARQGGLQVELGTANGTSTVETTHVLMATGRRPNVRDLGLEPAGVRFSPQGITVDAQLQTTAPGVYAIGDVTGKKQLAHVASHQGIVAAENALGHPAAFDDRAVPACTFTHPEIASVGLTEAEARTRHGDVAVGRFPFQALGRARAHGDTDGFVKIVAGARHGEVLGVHILGPAASDLISEGVLAIQLEATLDDLRAAIHAHPTFPEATAEAAWAAIGAPLHLPSRRAT